jgi:hypothetical protein
MTTFAVMRYSSEDEAPSVLPFLSRPSSSWHEALVSNAFNGSPTISVRLRRKSVSHDGCPATTAPDWSSKRTAASELRIVSGAVGGGVVGIEGAPVELSGCEFISFFPGDTPADRAFAVDLRITWFRARDRTFDPADFSDVQACKTSNQHASPLNANARQEALLACCPGFFFEAFLSVFLTAFSAEMRSSDQRDSTGLAAD